MKTVGVKILAFGLNREMSNALARLSAYPPFIEKRTESTKKESLFCFFATYKPRSLPATHRILYLLETILILAILRNFILDQRFQLT